MLTPEQEQSIREASRALETAVGNAVLRIVIEETHVQVEYLDSRKVAATTVMRDLAARAPFEPELPRPAGWEEEAVKAAREAEGIVDDPSAEVNQARLDAYFAARNPS